MVVISGFFILVNRRESFKTCPQSWVDQALIAGKLPFYPSLLLDLWGSLSTVRVACGGHWTIKKGQCVACAALALLVCVPSNASNMGGPSVLPHLWGVSRCSEHADTTTQHRLQTQKYSMGKGRVGLTIGYERQNKHRNLLFIVIVDGTTVFKKPKVKKKKSF